MEKKGLRARRRKRFHATLRDLAISALLLASVTGPQSRWRARAQGVSCGSSSTSTITVDSPSALATLNSTLSSCTSGEVNVIWDGVVEVDAQISISAGISLIIEGKDDLAEAQGGRIDGNRFFHVDDGGELRLSQLKLSKGTAGRGGAITSSGGNVTLKSCVFENNEATAENGGAVWAEGGELTIVGGEFLGNVARYLGGAIYSEGVALVVQAGTVFEDNLAVQGGAVFCSETDLLQADVVGAACSFSDAVFLSNNASRTVDDEFGDISETEWVSDNGGGGAVFVSADAEFTDSEFIGNYAQLSAGALFGDNLTDMTITGCVFRDNYAEGYGGAICLSSGTIGGGTVVRNNTALKNGGGVYSWDSEGSVELSNVSYIDNTAEGDGGGFYSNGRALINNGTRMEGNTGTAGGCVYCWRECNMQIAGGEFTTCQSSGNGAFAYASAGATLNITGGLVTNNTATKRGGVVYCSGESDDNAKSVVTIEGGTFADNEALEMGGAISAWGTVVYVKGGVFRNNTAKFYGGFIFLEEEASLVCEGGTIQANFAGDQGGGIYARDAIWVNSSCNLLGNESPQGAAAYLTYVTGSAIFEDLDIADNLAAGGSVIFAAKSSVVARNVTFESGNGQQDDSSIRALQLDSTSSLVAEDCVFTGWLGDTVIHSTNAAEGSLVVDSCDFSGSAATTVVISLYSDAEIRNAVVGDMTLENVAIVDGSPVLVDRAINCSQPNACGAGECVDSSLGVLCECLEADKCLDDGGALSIAVLTPPSTVTYSPDSVSFELSVSAAEDGITYAIWNMSFEADELSLDVVPSSGVLPPGGDITVTVSGSPLVDDVGGDLTSRFVVTSVGSDSTDSTAGAELEVASTFYLCRAFEYAVPNEDSDDGISCEQCADIDGADGVDCEVAGATLASLPVVEGYWRSSKESLVILPCPYPDACVGETHVSSSDDYCESGHVGPYCGVCAEGYGEGVGHTCHSCKGARAGALIVAGTIFSLFLLFLLVLALVFLVGGLDAIDTMGRSMTRTLSRVKRGAGHQRPNRAAVTAPVKRAGSLDDTMVTVFNCEKSMPGRHSAESPGVVALTLSAEAKSTEAKSTDTPRSTIDMGTRLVGIEMGTSDADIDAAAAGDTRPNEEPDDAGGCCRSGCCGLGEKVKRWTSRLPFDKLKILVVVWQILTVFPSITAVTFPPSYSRFLSWIDVVNLDLAHVLFASCILPSVNFYHRLLTTTLGPIVLAGVLVVTYHLAKRRAGIGSSGMVAKRSAWARHMAAGLLLTFLVFTSASTVIFKTFACDTDAVEGESYLRADYSLSCKTDTYMFFRVYAGFMLLVYPVGIPLLYAFILWRNRHSLNPTVHAIANAEPNPDETIDEEGHSGSERTRQKEKGGVVVGGQRAKIMSPEEMRELDEMVKMRRNNPELVPSMFLWKDFGPDLYYYEVIECGRRILLTGVLIFIAPYSSAQAAMACIFAFGSLLGFELLRPHLDPTDMWLYRLGCVVIFLSNFLALLIKVDAAGDGRRDALGGLLVAVNVILVVAVLFTSWFATQQAVDESREENESLALAKTMIIAEQTAANNVRKSLEHKSAAPPFPRVPRRRSPQASAGGVEPPRASSLGREVSRTGGVPSEAVRRSRSDIESTHSRSDRVSSADVEDLWLSDKAQGAPSR